ncbi:sensor domain-containing diguanylate cyclase [Pseudomonas zhanjiangensis]|uniref:Diguanylate cyclase n=1 Tax=Pseudomonas zhanjiangensis TaxID=3239015 RepID=A0ABV3YW56_9PSED
MTLRNRLLWLFAPLLLLTLLVVYALSERILLQRFDQQDEQALFGEARQLNLYLDTELLRHLNIVRSYALWDDSYAFVQHPEGGFLREQLETDALINQAFDFVLFLTPQMQVVGELWPLQQPSVGAPPPDRASLRDALVQRSRQLHRLDSDSEPRHFHQQLLMLDATPTLLLSHAIINSQGTSKPVGTLVAGYFIKGQRLQQLQQRTQAKLLLQPAESSGAGWQPLPSAKGETSSGALMSPRSLPEAGLQRVQLLFPNSSEEAELQIAVTLPRRFYQEGQHAIRFFLGTALLVALCAMLVVYLGLEFWVLQRIERLQQEVAAIGHDAHLPRLSDPGNDELGRLSTALNQMLERLEQSEARDRAILDSIQDGYFELDTRGRILTVNRALGPLLGYSSEQLIGRTLKDILSAEEVARASRQFSRARDADAGDTAAFIAPLQRGNGIIGHFETRVSPIHDADGAVVGYRGILRDISDQVAYQNQLLDMALRDPLTGLCNRKAFTEQLSANLQRARQQGGILALLYLDLDRFKEVNDSFGHAIGDALLIAVAERLRNCLRQADRLYRLGGDEFTVLMPSGNQEAAEKLAERLLAALVSPFELDGNRIDFVSPSIGIALFPEHASEAEALIKAADSAMYQAKQQRNRACVYRADQASRQR